MASVPCVSSLWPTGWEKTIAGPVPSEIALAKRPRTDVSSAQNGLGVKNPAATLRWRAGRVALLRLPARVYRETRPDRTHRFQRRWPTARYLLDGQSLRSPRRRRSARRILAIGHRK